MLNIVCMYQPGQQVRLASSGQIVNILRVHITVDERGTRIVYDYISDCYCGEISEFQLKPL